MKQFLNKLIFIKVQTDFNVMVHRCATVTDITDTHISIFDNYDEKPYFYAIPEIKQIRLSNLTIEDIQADRNKAKEVEDE